MPSISEIRRGPVEKGINSPPRGVPADSSEFVLWFNQIKSAFPYVITWSAKLTPDAFATTTNEQIFALAGIQPSDILWINKPSHQAGLSIGNVRCSGLGNLAITFVNQTAGNIVPNAETYLIGAIRL